MPFVIRGETVYHWCGPDWETFLAKTLQLLLSQAEETEHAAPESGQWGTSGADGVCFRQGRWWWHSCAEGYPLRQLVTQPARCTPTAGGHSSWLQLQATPCTTGPYQMTFAMHGNWHQLQINLSLWSWIKHQPSRSMWLQPHMNQHLIWH